MYLYTGVEASGFRAIIGLGDDLSVCLCWTGILFLGFCFFSLGFMRVWWMCAACVPELFSWCVLQECLVMLKDWNTGMN